jgi:hypothetical protein
MEEALTYELESRIPELVGNIYPTNAPETAVKPYLVYSRINTKGLKTLQGYTGKEDLSYMFSIMATKYSDMKALTKKVEAFLLSIPKTSIGEAGIYIEDLNINNITETWESELQVNRGIIDFTIYY